VLFEPATAAPPTATSTAVETITVNNETVTAVAVSESRFRRWSFIDRALARDSFTFTVTDQVSSRFGASRYFGRPTASGSEQLKRALVLLGDGLEVAIAEALRVDLTRAQRSMATTSVPTMPAVSASVGAAELSSTLPGKRACPAPTAVPTQEGPRGLRFDFNDGCRVLCPEAQHPWRVRLSDLDTGNILYDTELKAGRVNSTKRYFVRFRLEVWQGAERLLIHDYSAASREVLIRFPVETLGDALGWFPFAVKFRQRHGCRLTCAMNRKLIPLLRPAYPDITFVAHEELEAERYYATYTVAVYFLQNGTIFDHKDCVPCDFRHVGLHRAAGYVLGVDPTEAPPKIALADGSRPIPEPYVCIAVQSTMQSKYWNNPTGWREVVRFLKDVGYRVICIDQKPMHGTGLVWNHIPNEAEDETGDRPLQERARWIAHAEFFVGLSSGLSWLAWALGRPVVMISGFTHPLNEFQTPYRVINYHACNSCWNDTREPYNRQDFFCCPRHQDTPRQFECSRLITAAQVKQTIRRIPGFAARRENVGYSFRASKNE
jgi:autotransporter strand-loop-strand O-heptosyltransferase